MRQAQMYPAPQANTGVMGTYGNMMFGMQSTIQPSMTGNFNPTSMALTNPFSMGMMNQQTLQSVNPYSLAVNNPSMFGAVFPHLPTTSYGMGPFGMPFPFSYGSNQMQSQPPLGPPGAMGANRW